MPDQHGRAPDTLGPPEPAAVDVFDFAAVGIAFTDRSGRCQRVNEAFAAIVGRRREDLVGRSVLELTNPDDLPVPDRAVLRLLDRQGTTRQLEKRTVRPDGSAVWIDLSIRSLTDGHQEVVGLLIQALDITDRKHAEEEAEHDRQLLDDAGHLARLGSFEHDLASGQIHASRELCQLLGVPVGSKLELPDLMEQIHPDDRAHFATQLVRPGGGDVEVVHRLVRQDGTLRWVRACARWVPDEVGGPGRAIGTVLDVTELTLAEKELEHSSLHDSLTGLPNRLLLTDRLGQLLERARARQGTVAVMVLDLDRLKTINDSLGHQAGDEVLRRFATRLQATVRPGDVVGRFVGDEFAIACDNVTAEQAMRIVERLGTSFRSPITVRGEELRVSAAIGLTVAGDDDTAEDALRDAETAMYRAKTNGPSQVASFNVVLHEEVTGRLRAETALQQAIERAEFEVRYQPVVDLLENRVVGAEALLRWRSPERGTVPPEEFIPLAEQVGLISEIGDWVARRVCTDLPLLHPAGDDEFTVSTNLSALQLSDPGVLERFRRILASTGTQPTRLVAEVTETALIRDGPTALATLEALRREGIHVALDDFGTGCSSFTYLRQFPIDIVKIDKSFVGGIGVHEHDTLIVGAVLDLATHLHLTAVAEGVETADQEKELRRLGCRYAQGFRWSPALGPREFRALFDRPLAPQRSARVRVTGRRGPGGAWAEASAS